MVIDDFAVFFKAINAGNAPFPWQERLVRRVASDRLWPQTICLPTGCGKTSLIDIALFLLAYEGPKKDRVTPLRTFFVVDRRLIVDQAEEHARQLATALSNAETGILGEVATRLRAFGAEPLRVAKLRGGMAYEGFWCEDPRQPTVVATTVDQLGSRLLFRGYGCSEGRRPIEAGLVGNDSLIIVDEAHLSNPLLDTLSSVHKLGADIRWLQMSATARGKESVFQLEPDDLKDRVLSRRLKASKLARLRKCTDIVPAAVTAAVELAAKFRVTGIVVNTVDVARRVFEQLVRLPGSTAVLLIGRVRPFDRDHVLAQWLPRIRAGRDRSLDQRIFVVATQTIEVGADIDVDALVTEAAPLDVLRQRFGRLDRRGEIGNTDAVVLRGAEDFRAYGEATAKTWAWLNKSGKRKGGERLIDFGVLEMNRRLEQLPPEDLFSPAAHAPSLLQAHLEAWCQTSQVPDADPAVGPFLHGPDAFDVDEVQLVWRADLEDNWLEAVIVTPPNIQEAMPVPVWEVRRWLGSRQVLRWHGVDDPRTGVVSASAIRPGDTVVVPSSYGGADPFGWHPNSTTAVEDVADEVGTSVRLHPAFLELRSAARIARLVQSEELDSAALAKLVRELGIDGVNLQSARKYGSGIVLRQSPQPVTDGDAASATSSPVALEHHSKGVERWVHQFASMCGLPADQIEALAMAARFHDLGKSDPRFQAILRGGNLLEAYRALGRGEVLAKSGSAWTLADYRTMRAAVGYPSGARHEAGSVLAAACRDVSSLALHLIAAHHGHARPSLPMWSEEPPYTFPVQVDGVTFEISPGAELGGIDSPVIDRFWSLCSSLGH
jgi:CRISPR-associated endonuclease/helicase Cas3